MSFREPVSSAHARERGSSERNGCCATLESGVSKLVSVRWEGDEALASSRHNVEYDFKYDGLGFATLAFNDISGLGRGGTGTLKVDGKVVAAQTLEPTVPLILMWDETFDNYRNTIVSDFLGEPHD